MGASLPGYKAGRTVTPREIKFAMEANQGLYLPGGGLFDFAKSIDGGNTGYTHELRAGWIVGQITASKKWRPCPRSQVNMTGATATEIVLDNAAAFIVGDIVTIGADTDLEITAIDYSTNTITITSTAVADNEVVFAQDGSAVARGILDDFLDLEDEDGVAQDQVGKILIDGKVKQEMLLGDDPAIIAVWTSMLMQGIQIYSSGGVRVV